MRKSVVVLKNFPKKRYLAEPVAFSNFKILTIRTVFMELNQSSYQINWKIFKMLFYSVLSWFEVSFIFKRLTVVWIFNSNANTNTVNHQYFYLYSHSKKFMIFELIFQENISSLKKSSFCLTTWIRLLQS